MVLTAGSTGDVEPFAALAGALARRGHAVTLVADAEFERLTPGEKVDFEAIRADFHSLLPTPERKRPSIRGDVLPVIQGMLEDCWIAARAVRPEIIVAHQKTLAAPHLAERLGIPHVRALTVPMLTPTRAFAVPGLIRHDLGGALNRTSYRLVGLLSRPYAGLSRRWRRNQLTLAPRGKPPRPARTLYCYSPSLVPTPKDWPPDTVATGYWLRDETHAEPVDPALAAFVDNGSPTVYIGFGSSVGSDPAGLGAAVGEAVQRAGVRAVIATGWGAISGVRSGADTLVVDRVPHRWLFPRVAAVVHHGGAGTTAAGLIAARPTVVCPFQGDQYFWGAAVDRAGVGPRPVPVKRLRPDSLAAAIRAAVSNAEMHARAAELSTRITHEDGTTRASEQIEDVLD